MLVFADDLMAGLDLPAESVPAASTARFPDGADFRIEIPSVEGPGVLADRKSVV